MVGIFGIVPKPKVGWAAYSEVGGAMVGSAKGGACVAAIVALGVVVTGVAVTDMAVAPVTGIGSSSSSELIPSASTSLGKQR